MKKQLTLLLFLLGNLGLAPALAAPVHYQINFNATSGVLPSSGRFTYDSAVPAFSNFRVTWQGIVYDLTADANAPDVTGSCMPGPAGSFLLLSTGTCDGINSNEAQPWSAYVNQSSEGAAFSFYSPHAGYLVMDIDQPLTFNNLDDATAFGNFTISEVPEPSSYALLGLGCAAILYRRRMA
ncbi:MAG: PEP-CTERM sorting domain-containing protein [Bryobacterales bacterium]|nr:PEP-CTERM sorting domain-containing protein [Bryobacterales bacterium]